MVGDHKLDACWERFFTGCVVGVRKVMLNIMNGLNISLFFYENLILTIKADDIRRRHLTEGRPSVIPSLLMMLLHFRIQNDAP